MIFKTVNTSIEKTAYNIQIKNIDLAAHHWGSEKKIADYLDEIENFLYDSDSFNKKIALHAVKLMKENHRISNIKFYRIPDENKLILLAFTDVKKFKEFETFSREMEISFKKLKFAFSIVELLKEEAEEMKAGTKTIPNNWILDEQLTDKFAKMKDFII